MGCSSPEAACQAVAVQGAGHEMLNYQDAEPVTDCGLP